ncbi:Uu.00g090400.m01.CDS01 [Anthostomella pinea]|uniref:Uu.00g090400.m01.CDS01 n=1 Tax=Anthostomella pinea TaxID=933095 RepID=A0AAI8VMV6_9PEZI|nr:Uu.00g090400.m01.CDS01 [Anthostomella pinea]
MSSGGGGSANATGTTAPPSYPTDEEGEQYLEKVIDGAKKKGIEWPSDLPPGCRTRAVYNREFFELPCGTNSVLPDEEPLKKLCAEVANELSVGHHSVCVVQNITPVLIGYLGALWKIDHAFFAEHARNKSTRCIRTEAQPWSKVDNLQLSDARASGLGYGTHCMHIDAIFECEIVDDSIRFIHDDRGREGRWSNFFTRMRDRERSEEICATRLSYCRVNEYMYLVLVDSPVTNLRYREVERVTRRWGMRIFKEGPTGKTYLRLPYSSLAQEALLLPPPYVLEYPYTTKTETNMDLLECFSAFLREPWHTDYLFATSSVILPHPLLYMLAGSLWQDNLRHLDREIKYNSFSKVRRANEGTNEELHDMRKDLDTMKRSSDHTIEWMPKGLGCYFEDAGMRRDDLIPPTPSPLKRLSRTKREAKELGTFLMETFQLLASSLSARDSLLSIQQSGRATKLTALAFVYVPLSFVTGIFGMNIKEINGSPISFWVCFATLGVVIGITLAGYELYKLYRLYKAFQALQASQVQVVAEGWRSVGTLEE